MKTLGVVSSQHEQYLLTVFKLKYNGFTPKKIAMIWGIKETLAIEFKLGFQAANSGIESLFSAS